MASQNHAVIDLTGDFPPPEPQDPELGSHEDLEADIGHSLALRPASRDQRQVGRLTAQQSETNSPQQLVTQGQSLISHFFRPRQTTAVGVAGSAQVLVPALGRHQASILGLGLPSAVPGVFGPREARLSGPDPNPAEPPTSGFAHCCAPAGTCI
ncbi:uncharacterized protein BCR38DRAFT_191819 [Pseudomassariella vexata]|uniref:Uncharacterized protein n=1 Tax=Pseudomassariella vexata TaxID=1141098 RepID=A0A1Y2E0R0_9PEZI|nr:uncharacterized protein BCR38DRAFT_191819 [Pseudomassariella vexata]ORY65120.1 hypothetical protein BCR38DRAFT_191819 [Pseudomassariella vexata]